MEQLSKLITEQQKLCDDLSKGFSNMKKDSKTRKTEKYLEGKAVDIEGMWQKIQIKHSEIQQLDSKQENNYFKTDYFGQAEALYQKTCAYIQDCVDALVANKEKFVDDQRRATKLVDQARRIELLKQDIECAKLAGDGFTQYLDDIKAQWLMIVENDVELNRSPLENRTCKYFQEDWFAKIRALYREITIHLDKKVREQNMNVATMPNPRAQSNTLLPKIVIPFFDGEYEEWPTFQDIFKKVIHDNKSISKVEKLQYLKSYVKGEASKAIQHFEITENNYDSAWKELEERFDNKRRIVNTLLNKILQLPMIHNESAEQLKSMYNTVKECLEAIKMQNIDTSNWDPMVVCIIANKWDSRTNELYETSLETSFEMQSLDSVLKFLLKRFQAMEAAEPKGHNIGKGFIARYGDQQYAEKANCKYCKSNHAIYACTDFKALSSSDRFNFVKERKLCYNCLNHDFGKKCFSQTKCRSCDKNHHTLLHRDETENNDSNKKSDSTSEKLINEKHVHRISSSLAFQKGTSVLLATAIIKVRNASNGYEFLRALIDPGSQAAFATEETAFLLRLPRENINAEIIGIGDGDPRICHKTIRVNCKARFSSTFSLNTELFILPTLTKNTPEEEVKFETADWANYMLADPTFGKPGPIDIILGAREYKETILNGLKKTDSGLLGQNTEFGYIILGTSDTETKTNLQISSVMTRITQENDDIAKFCELENVMSETTVTNQEDKKSKFSGIEDVTSENSIRKPEIECDKLYDEITKRHDDGTYTVKIPFKSDDTELGKSRSQAMARPLKLDNHLQKENKHGSDYKEFMPTQLNLGHMVKIPKHEEQKTTYYIPHQDVTREIEKKEERKQNWSHNFTELCDFYKKIYSNTNTNSGDTASFGWLCDAGGGKFDFVKDNVGATYHATREKRQFEPQEQTTPKSGEPYASVEMRPLNRLDINDPLRNHQCPS